MLFIEDGAPVIVQGMTGHQGMTHTARMLKAGTNIVGGVNARKAGQRPRKHHCGNHRATHIDARIARGRNARAHGFYLIAKPCFLYKEIYKQYGNHRQTKTKRQIHFKPGDIGVHKRKARRVGNIFGLARNRVQIIGKN